MTPSRRIADPPGYVRCFRFITAPIVDGNTGRPSITRLMAIAGFALVWHAVEAGHSISGTQLTMYVTSLSAAFGKSTFGFFLTRYQMRQSLTETRSDTHNDTHTVTETINRQITERRDADRGFEAT